MKRYFDNEDEGSCYGISYFRELMKESNEEIMELWLGERETGVDHFYCSHFGEVGLKEDSGCGKTCEGYSPLNGKNGRCKHSKNTYFPAEKYILTMKNGKFKLKKSTTKELTP